MVNRPSGFKFAKLDSIGAPDAELDNEFFDDCFVDTGDYSALASPTDSHILLLGRTGSGKSALLRRLTAEQELRTIRIEPESLALSEIAGSQILKFVAALDINLDPLFKLLWRHVFTVEILRKYFEQHGPNENKHSIGTWLYGLFNEEKREDKEMRQAIDYLKKWGESFWEDTEYRVREVTQKFESEIGAAIEAKVGNLASLSAEASRTLSKDVVTDVSKRTQEIVSLAQVKDLSNVSKLLARVLSDRQQPYFIVVDQLDENWAEEALRYQLIKALILTAREFIGVPNAKVVLAIRRDLIDRMFRLTRDSGFQEEKYSGFYLPLTWTKENILRVLDNRVSRLVARRYTTQRVTFKDVLPEDFDGDDIGTAIFRLAPRPRDVIALFNCCILAGIDKQFIGTREFSIAVGEYSRQRLRALADEWYAEYPLLVEYATALLKGKTASFKAAVITDKELEESSWAIAAKYPDPSGLIHSLSHAFVAGSIDASAFREGVLHGFYKVGLVGLKIAADSKSSWADDSGQSVSRGELSEGMSVSIHPAYQRALGIGGARGSGAEVNG